MPGARPEQVAAAQHDPSQFWGPGGQTIFDDPPSAAYVHVPFCRHRCGYCNFTLVARRDDLIERYLSALQRDLHTLEAPHPVDTLYLGGGTPSYLPAAQLQRLCQLVVAAFPLRTGGEWTVEANPNDISADRVAVLREAGVTRVSLGVQSMSPTKLKVLERDHDERDVGRACERLSDAAINVSVDLIFAVPGESYRTWIGDLDAVGRMPIQHVSTYGLTFERGTAFWGRLLSGDLQEQSDRRQRRLYQAAIERLTAAGWEHYEVSSFARPGFRCRHNQVYWQGRSYFAAGPGAAGYRAGRRTVNHRSTTTYLQRIESGSCPWESSEVLTARQRALELLVFCLRMRDGVDQDEFQQRTGWSVRQLAGAAMDSYLQAGWMERVGKRLRLTCEGLLISDALWPSLLGPDEQAGGENGSSEKQGSG